ncbi:hypothetical protein CHLNCDRAFT_135416 [Chlorella variabilis]|uniref:MalT-like TPR region domain-containing protein n=1 Tax=Chlorella variabilis TaxID=554065 RepID=E1ZI65_CHLVA|nr:hypothetical protein CHLNCDRAFT_135416 [Chlorella variabilis]EFN54585.1 hypothetical protein CHLNCDRAFT_135416 [Chlorella variabilis]|eukprot:XP_005846687.1 hypothetical protein CHLNCDRAFT_135416 [Chlorella variabilis]
MQAVPPPAAPLPGGPGEPGPLAVGVIMGFQAAALIGATVTGILARRRREEMQGLNRKLRHINAELRRQREAQDSLLTAVGLAAAQPEGEEREEGGEGGGAAAIQAAAALEALRRQQEALQEERGVLEAALRSPSAAHPTEGFGDERLSLARARRQIAQCIRGGKELVQAGRPGEVFPLIEQGLQLAAETADVRAERALVRVRARALRDAGKPRWGDPAGALRDLRRSIALSQQLGEGSGDADTFGEMGDILTELGDLEAAGQYYDKCIAAIQTEGVQPLGSTWDA